MEKSSTEMLDRLVARVEEYVAAAASPEAADEAELASRFDALATEIVVFQAMHLEPIAQLWRAHGIEPLELTDWRRAPPVPTTAFQSHELYLGEVERIFRSSGTTSGGEQRSAHHHSQLDLYRRIVDASFPRFSLPEGRVAMPTLALIPPSPIVPESSLAFMVEHLLERFSEGDSRYASGGGGLHPRAATEWLDARVRDQEPVLILTTAIAIWDLCVELAERGRELELPPESVVFETGGFKTRDTEVTRAELLEMVERRLGLAGDRVVREYGMTEWTSQAYTEVLRGGDADRFVTPPWMRVRVLDPETLQEQSPGEPGLIACLDLGNVASAASVLTQDVGVADDRGGFVLEGRATGAALRGCSQLHDQLG